jgi:hypothetical protein
MEHRCDLINLWARADTLAFCLFLPIVRDLRNKNEVDSTKLDFACSAATLAVDLHNLMKRSRV